MQDKQTYPAAAINGMVKGLRGTKDGHHSPLVGNLYSLIGYAIGQVKPKELEQGSGEEGEKLLDLLEVEEGKSIDWVSVLSAAGGLLQVLFPSGIPMGRTEDHPEEEQKQQQASAEEGDHPEPIPDEGRGHI